MFRYLFLFFTFCFIFTGIAFADTAANDLITILNRTQTIKANFTQTIYDNRGKSKQKSYGHMALQRPGKFRWDMTKPQPQLIIANGNKLWVYDPDLSQLTIRSLKQTSGETPALLLSHDNADIQNHFVIKSMKKDSNNLLWFSLKSKHRDKMFQLVEMGFKQDQIHEMRLQDNLGHKTVIQFQDIRTNVSLPSSLFSFKSPPRIDVIDETRK